MFFNTLDHAHVVLGLIMVVSKQNFSSGTSLLYLSISRWSDFGCQFSAELICLRSPHGTLPGMQNLYITTIVLLTIHLNTQSKKHLEHLHLAECGSTHKFVQVQWMWSSNPVVEALYFSHREEAFITVLEQIAEMCAYFVVHVTCVHRQGWTRTEVWAILFRF